MTKNRYVIAVVLAALLPALPLIADDKVREFLDATHCREIGPTRPGGRVVTFAVSANNNLSDEYIREREDRLAALGYSEDKQTVKWHTTIAYADERSPEQARYKREALAKAAKAGVKLLTGSDSMPIGEIGWLEMEQLVLSGVSEMDTLIAATRNPVELLGVLDSFGTIEVGKVADLVVIAENPLDNISNIRTISQVFKGGVPVNMSPPPGTKRFYDYFESNGPPGAFSGKSEKAAGFVRKGNPYADQ